MTSDELDRLEALANAATPGPWQTNEGTRWTVSKTPGSGLTSAGTFFVVSMEPDDAADAAFIAAARDAVPALVGSERAKDAEIARLRALVEAAYEEGEANGIADSHGMAHEGWSVSYARQALEGA